MKKRYFALILAMMVAFGAISPVYAQSDFAASEVEVEVVDNELPLGNSGDTDVESNEPTEPKEPTESKESSDIIILNPDIDESFLIDEKPLGLSGLELPESLPMSIDGECKVETSDDVYIKNNSDYTIEITSIYINLNDDWNVQSMEDNFNNKPIDTKLFALVINDKELSSNGEINDISWILEPEEQLKLDYYARFTAQRYAMEASVGNLDFVYRIYEEDDTNNEFIDTGDIDNVPEDELIDESQDAETPEVVPEAPAIPETPKDEIVLPPTTEDTIVTDKEEDVPPEQILPEPEDSDSKASSENITAEEDKSQVDSTNTELESSEIIVPNEIIDEEKKTAII